MASKSGGMSTSERRHRVTLVAATFLRPGCPTEVNVKGSTRSAALAAVTAAEQGAEDVGFFAGKGDTEAVAAAQAVQAATEALLDLAREVHSVILHDIWPRFLESPEFETLMTFTVCKERSTSYHTMILRLYKNGIDKFYVSIFSIFVFFTVCNCIRLRGRTIEFSKYSRCYV